MTEARVNRGFALVDGCGRLYTPTVSSTERGAMVRALTLRDKCTPTCEWTDAAVTRAFDRHLGGMYCHRIAQIEIREAPAE